MQQSQLLAHCGGRKLSREELRAIPTPEGSATHRPLPHHDIVEALIETMSFRHIGVVRDEYAVSHDGMKMFGVLELQAGFTGCRFAIGIRNANDKSMRLAMTVGYRVFVCDNLAFYGDFTPVLHKHTKNLHLTDALSVGVDRMQRNFEPMKNQVEQWQVQQISDDRARLIIYQAFIEGELDAPKYLAREVHRHYFQPEQEWFTARTVWSLSNAFTSAFKALDPIPQYKATARLASFFGSVSDRCLPAEDTP